MGRFVDYSPLVDMLMSFVLTAAIRLFAKLFYFLRGYRRRSVKRGCQFKLQEIERKTLFHLLMEIVGFVCVVYILFLPAWMNAGARLWLKNADSVKPRLEEVHMFKTPMYAENCWSGHIWITDDTTQWKGKIPVMLQICAESSTTELRTTYSDSASVRAPDVRGGGYQWISGKLPCIGADCPPVSISDNYIGIPTTDQITNKTHYYIFLLPTLALRNHGMADSQESMDVLWKDVVNWFEFLILVFMCLMLYHGIFNIIPYIWNSPPVVYLRKRLWSSPVDSVRCTARLLFVNKEDIIVDIEDFPMPEPGLEAPAANNNDQTSETDESDDDYMSCISEDNDINDPAVPGGQRSEESSDCDSVVSAYQEENRCRSSRPIYQGTVGWCDSGTSDNQTSETSESENDHMSVTSEDYDTSSDSSFSAVEDTHSPPVSVAPFSSGGVVFEDYSEQTRQDPVGGE